MSKDTKYPKILHKLYGCDHCFLKFNDSCPHKMIGDMRHSKGYCEDLFDTIMSLIEPDDKTTAIRGKVLSYEHELQKCEDGKRFKELEHKLRIALDTGADKKTIAELTAQVDIYKMWWARLIEKLQPNLNKISDREQKQPETQTNHLQINLNQIHGLMNEAKKRLEDKKNNVIDIEVNEDGT